MPVAKQPFLSKFQDPKARDWAYYQSPDEIRRQPALLGYAHHILRAFDKDVLGITGVLCIDSRPTIYFRRDKRALSWVDANHLHRVFWNQGIATVLILADPERLRIYSAQAKPVDQGNADEKPPALIDAPLEDIADLLELEKLLYEVASGQFYHDHADRFDEKQAVDEFLLQNLAAARDRLITGSQKFNKEETAHALLGRLIFLCYLTDRKVIDWADYEKEVGKGITNVRQLLVTYDAKEGLQRLYRLFTRLHQTFNGSMFDQNLETEARRLKPAHYEVLRQFFSISDVVTGQGTLGFWAYDFSVIPVETISAIYEDFLSTEDAEGKRKEGAYYTPRHLAEMVVDIAIADDPDWAKRRYLDSACGSGIFLVTLFNRLASHWVFNNDNASYRKRADALLKILHDQLCGVDIKRTACRIACFSLYLAFLDQFDPRDIRDFAQMAKRGRKVLPKLLRYQDSRWRENYNPTILHGNFLQPGTTTEKFDYVIGNPPWSDRGTKQKAWEFMQHAPQHLRDGALGCLLLPAKVFFNKTDDLQKEWFTSVTVERIVNLSDFSFILFEHAKCPALIVRFANAKPIEAHRFRYETPKVSGTDCRDGVITVFPRDRKCVEQNALLAAIDKKLSPSFWKRHFSGTPRDWRLIDLLDDMPKLKQHVANPRRGSGRQVPFFGGEGIQPNGGDRNAAWWKDSTPFVDARSETIALNILEWDCVEAKEHLPRIVHRERDERLFKPPLVVISRGFGKVALVDFPVVFQHALYSISPTAEDSSTRKRQGETLKFLAAYLRSKLAWYYIFHTASSLALERDQVHRIELLELPFPLPGNEYAHRDGESVVKKVAKVVDSSRREIEKGLNELHKQRERLGLERGSKEFKSMLKDFTNQRLDRVASSQGGLDRLIYRYFDLTDEEVALVEDTASVYQPSATPTSREKVREGKMPTLTIITPRNLQQYAHTLVGTLNEWAEDGRLQVEASVAQFEGHPFALLHLRQTKKPRSFHFEKVNHHTEAVLERIYDAARQKQGRFNHPRTVTFFDGTSIYLLKPNSLMHWTRSTALNDADEIFAEVVRQRRAKTA